MPQWKYCGCSALFKFLRPERPVTIIGESGNCCRRRTADEPAIPTDNELVMPPEPECDMRIGSMAAAEKHCERAGTTSHFGESRPLAVAVCAGRSAVHATRQSGERQAGRHDGQKPLHQNSLIRQLPHEVCAVVPFIRHYDCSIWRSPRDPIWDPVSRRHAEPAQLTRLPLRLGATATDDCGTSDDNAAPSAVGTWMLVCLGLASLLSSASSSRSQQQPEPTHWDRHVCAFAPPSPLLLTRATAWPESCLATRAHGGADLIRLRGGEKEAAEKKKMAAEKKKAAEKAAAEKKRAEVEKKRAAKKAAAEEKRAEKRAAAEKKKAEKAVEEKKRAAEKAELEEKRAVEKAAAEKKRATEKAAAEKAASTLPKAAKQFVGTWKLKCADNYAAFLVRPARA
jgi:hypothetical protein